MLKKLSYQTKLYIGVSCMILVILLVSGGVFFRYSEQNLRQQLESNTTESLKVVQSRVEDQCRSMEEITKRLQASSALLEIASEIPEKEGNYFVQNAKSKQRINGLFLESIISEDLNSSLHYMNYQGDYYSTFLNIYPYSEHVFSDEEAKSYCESLDTLLGKKYELSLAPHTDVWTDTNHQVFSVIRVIRNNFQKFGYVEMTQDVEVLDQLANLNEMDEDYEIFILKDGQVFYQNGERNLEKVKKNFDPYQMESGNSFFSDNNTLWISSISEKLGWTFVMRRSVLEANKSIYDLRKVIFFSYAAGFGIVLIFLYIMTKRMIKPLRNLRDHMLVLSEEEQMKPNITWEKGDEVAALTESIESLFQEIRVKDHVLEEARRQNIQAHLNNLEAQINPHFLYNTLAVIGATGLESGNEDVHVMCETLAGLFRYSIKYENRPVPLKDEIENVRQYLFLMQKRYESRLVVKWELQEEVQETVIPKLLFQPIVENAFRHGFSGQKPPWHMELSTWQSENRWFFQVKNDGELFDTEVLDALEKRMKLWEEGTDSLVEKEDAHGYGLENTLKRLCFYYKEQSFFQVVNEEDWVSITIGGECLWQRESKCFLRRMNL